MRFKGFMDMPMNEEIFANMQKENPWFQVDDGMFGAMFGGVSPLDLSNKKDGEELTPTEMSQLVFAKIFGSFGFDKDLDEAEDICINRLSELDKVKPIKDRRRDNEQWMMWQNQFGQYQIQLGTVYAYMQEPIKAAYHFMLGLKSEMVRLNMPYCDFIRYTIAKLTDLPKTEATYGGQGFIADKPIGYKMGEKIALDVELAKAVIPEMEGNNGEVIVARQGNTVFYGHLTRLGSVAGGIDIYETWLIDKNYNLKTIKFYFNGYRYAHILNPQVVVADGFSIKPHSVLHNVYEFVGDKL